VTYAAQDLWREAAYVAYHFHWGLDDILDLEHPTRRRIIAEIATLDAGARRGR
jgi:hypothetical protein